MKRIKFGRRPLIKIQPREIYPVNEKIRDPQLRVIDENGQMLGVLPTFQALQMAKERELDLVVVSPKAEPPVAKFLSYSSFKYQKEKEARKQKAQQKAGEMKEIRLSPRIGRHDLEIRLKQAEKFLNRGDKVVISLFLKGRERQHADLGKEIIEKFISDLSKIVEIKFEQEIKRQGSNFSAIILTVNPKLD
ncbi:MAG: translation initiation factor IF-3 [Candidatus Buchananbacteria bacterium RBG_13_36_9]|jgi:translation initiation factor IF-3|uniref:Translation initiation factor IF-3 n=1 Tax=Candidatus Buchananbacteria bacterium RBG_13_36_9 TaxID=1797530 RepID=A0A1G1XQD2_9BACT|nr:MAG: translation initiation factor IF-3 [Candidatus Buchananbacteria bacterium RBG_13_36_9]